MKLNQIYTSHIELFRDLESEVEFILDEYDLDSNFDYMCLSVLFFIDEDEPNEMIMCSFKTSTELLHRKFHNYLDLFTMFYEINDSNVLGIKVTLYLNTPPELKPLPIESNFEFKNLWKKLLLMSFILLKIAFAILMIYYFLFNVIYCSNDLEMQIINDNYSNSILRIIEQIDLNSPSTVHINESYFEEIDLNDDTNSNDNFNFLRRGNNIIDDNLISPDRFLESTFRFSLDNSTINVNDNSTFIVNKYLKYSCIFVVTSATLITTTILLVKILH